MKHSPPLMSVNPANVLAPLPASADALLEEPESDAMIDSIYAYAYDFYQRGQLDEAEKFFRYLCIYDFFNPDYLMGLAAVFQLKKQFVQARDLYAIAHKLDPDDYHALLYNGQCLLALRLTAEATECFRTLCEHCQDQELTRKARGYLQLLSKHQAKPTSA